MVEITNLSKIYNKGKSNELVALDNINLTIQDGEMIAIIGKSGAGKSTLLHILGCIDCQDEGKYLFNGIDVSAAKDKQKSQLRNSEIGIILQDFALVEECSAVENVMIPMRFGKRKKDKKSLAIAALQKVGIADLAERQVSRLSGGQKQRVAIARAIVNNPALILADEPTGALDEKTSIEIIDVLKELNQQGITVIIITHDLEVAKRCERCIEISDGKVEES